MSNRSARTTTLTFRGIATFSGAVSILLGLSASIGWIAGMPVLTGTHSTYIPMAPDTGAAFIILGMVLFFHERLRDRRRERIGSLVLLACLSLYGVLKSVEYVVHTDLTFGSILFPATEKIGSYFIKQMSPITGMTIFLAGVALIVKLASGIRSRIDTLVSSIGIVILLVGFIASIGYLFGTPLLYGGTIIPLAALTSVGFFVLGIGLVAIAGGENIFVRLFVGDSAKAQLLRVFLPVAIITVIVQGLLEERIDIALGYNHALVTALFSLFFAAIMAAVVVQFFTVFFRRIEKAEVAALQKENQFRTVLESVSLIGLILDVDGNITLCNDFLLSLTGWTRDEVLGKNWFRMFLPAEIQSSIEIDLFRRTIEQGELPVHYENELVTRSGQRRMISWSNTVLRNSSNGIINIASIGEDITERKLAEKKLHESNDRLNIILENSPIAIWDWDIKADTWFATQKYFTMLGYEAETGYMDRTVWLGRLHPDDRDAVRTKIENVLLHGSADYSYDARMLHADGSYRWQTVIGHVIETNADGTAARMLGVRIDITDRKQAEENLRRIEERLRQSEKMDAIGQLAGGIAHDFNNILGGIIGYTDMSLAYAANNTILKNNLLKVLNAADRAKNLVKQILAFSRQGNPQRSTTALQPVIAEVLDLLMSSIPSSVVIESDLRTNTKPVLADSTQIHQAVLNLATNAVHAMNRKGTLTIRLYGLTLETIEHGQSGEIAPGTYTVIEVADTGCGMDAATLAKAFEPFFTTKAVGEGTGMGLSVVLGIVQSHGGNILVEANRGKARASGSTSPPSKNRARHRLNMPSAAVPQARNGSCSSMTKRRSSKCAKACLPGSATRSPD